MRIRISQLALSLDYQRGDVVAAVCKKLGCRSETVGRVKAVRRSIDARAMRGGPMFVLTVELNFNAKSLPFRARRSKDVQIVRVDEPAPTTHESTGLASGAPRPIVVGAGPAGLMAALTLAEANMAPLLIERGQAAGPRREIVGRFWHDGRLDEQTNVLFGEGGAGLFSDGKLIARSKDRAGVMRFLQTLAECGASQDILIDAAPHIGSDCLATVVGMLRQRIEQAGGEVRFGAKLEDLIIEGGSLRGVRVDGSDIRTDICILAAGHSARDVYEMLDRAGVKMSAKAFAIGVRLELPQRLIDASQWGPAAGHPRLGAASFRLTQAPRQPLRACYSFCTCPGGRVIACASAGGQLATNGMSLSTRGGALTNAGFIVPVTPADFGGQDSPLAGIEFQGRIERSAFAAGGGDFSLPASRLGDFLAASAEGPAGSDLPAERSCKRARPANLLQVLPDFVCETLVAAVPRMLKKLSGVRVDDVMVYAPETRSSSPVRILREADGQSITLRGLFPAGEGAGYAGGIVSSAVDGLRAAELAMHALAASY